MELLLLLFTICSINFTLCIWMNNLYDMHPRHINSYGPLNRYLQWLTTHNLKLSIHISKWMVWTTFTLISYFEFLFLNFLFILIRVFTHAHMQTRHCTPNQKLEIVAVGLVLVFRLFLLCVFFGGEGQFK